MKKRDRLCWWCNQKLMVVSHAVIQDHDGRNVQVHKICEKSARAYVKPVTANTPDAIETDLLLRRGYSRKDAVPMLEQDLADAAEEDGM